MNDVRTCIKCKVEKSIEDYSLETIYSGKSRNPIKNRRTVCKECRKFEANTRRRTEDGKRRKRLYTIKWRHDISASEYLEMVDKQENLCAICGCPPSAKALAVDHDHKTNKTRELLCVSCNFALGWFKDDTEVMQKAISYINKHEALDSSKTERDVVVDWGSSARPAKIMRAPRSTRRYGLR